MDATQDQIRSSSAPLLCGRSTRSQPPITPPPQGCDSTHFDEHSDTGYTDEAIAALVIPFLSDRVHGLFLSGRIRLSVSAVFLLPVNFSGANILITVFIAKYDEISHFMIQKRSKSRRFYQKLQDKDWCRQRYAAGSNPFAHCQSTPFSDVVCYWPTKGKEGKDTYRQYHCYCVILKFMFLSLLCCEKNSIQTTHCGTTKFIHLNTIKHPAL